VPQALRKTIYTINPIESLTYQLRKIIKSRGHCPNDAALINPWRISEIGLSVG
jgi:putative transposase